MKLPLIKPSFPRLQPQLRTNPTLSDACPPVPPPSARVVLQWASEEVRFNQFWDQVLRYREERGSDHLPVSVLDIGGCPEYWHEVYDLRKNPLNLRITLLHERAEEWRDHHFHYFTGDHTNLGSIKDRVFDFAYSVLPFRIKDLGLQSRLIAEMKRVASEVFIRTP